MDLQTKLKQIDKNKNDPLMELENIFGDATLEKWLQYGFGDLMRKCLSELFRDLSSKKKVGDNKPILATYMAILDGVIPPMPNFMDENSKPTSKHCNDVEVVDKLICKIINPLFALVSENPQDLETMSNVFLKATFHASEATIKDNDYVFSKYLYKCLCLSFRPFCSAESHTIMAFIVILGRKMSNAWFYATFNSNIFLVIRFALLRHCEKMCPYVDNLRKLYTDLDLEKQIEMRDPTWNQLMVSQDMFQGQNFEMALQAASNVISQKNVHVQKIIQSDVFPKFNSILCSPYEIGETSFILKSFLKVFLQFVEGPDSCYSWSNSLFECLVRLIKISTEGYVYLIKSFRDSTKVHNAILSNNEPFQKEIITALNMLHSLYILNTNWYQWLDIAEESNIINKNIFGCYYFTKCFDEELKCSNGRLPWFIDMMKLCPAITPMSHRIKMLKKSLPEERGEKTFEISRKNVLRDILRIFQKHKKHFSDHWMFTFKDEIGTGPGVTREAYSILSQELQRHDINLWQGVPVERSGTFYTHSPTGLLPKKTKKNRPFKFLGQILAKAFMDDQLLDIPISDEFFIQLTTNKQPHLRKEYFDLLKTFPMLKSLFKQILPVKRKIESLRSEVGLSQHQKHEIISNLTFDDGSSFDDLCLNFTVPGTDVELMEGGREVILSPHNIDLYLEKLCAHNDRIEPKDQFKAIRRGFDQVLSLEKVAVFLPHELKRLICCDQFKRWTMDELLKYCAYEDSQSVRFLFQCLASFDIDNQKMFLKFVTGMTGLPYGGLCNLKIPLTISRIRHDQPDSTFPSAATCSNNLFLPDYSSLNVTRQKLLHAIREGTDSFQIV